MPTGASTTSARSRASSATAHDALRLYRAWATLAAIWPPACCRRAFRSRCMTATGRWRTGIWRRGQHWADSAARSGGAGRSCHHLPAVARRVRGGAARDAAAYEAGRDLDREFDAGARRRAAAGGAGGGAWRAADGGAGDRGRASGGAGRDHRAGGGRPRSVTICTCPRCRRWATGSSTWGRWGRRRSSR